MGLLSSFAMLLKNGLWVRISSDSSINASNSEKTLMYLMSAICFTSKLVLGPRSFFVKYDVTLFLMETDFPT